MNSFGRPKRSSFWLWMQSLLAAALAMVLGAVLGGLTLVTKPVEVVRKAPNLAEWDPDQVFFQPGERDSNRGRLWSQKRRMLVQKVGGAVSFTEHELNQWLGGRGTTPRIKPKPGEAAPPMDTFTHDGWNFRVADGVLQVGLPGQLNLFSDPIPVVFQARGGFAKENERWVFAANEVWLGSLPLHRFPGMLEQFRLWQAEPSRWPEEVNEVWGRVASATVTDRTVELQMR